MSVKTAGKIPETTDLNTVHEQPLPDNYADLRSLISRSIQFNNIDDLIRFAQSGVNVMDIESFVHSLDHALLYLRRCLENNFIIFDIDRFHINDVAIAKHRLNYIQYNLTILRQLIPAEDLQRFNESIRAVLATVDTKLYGMPLSVD